MRSIQAIPGDHIRDICARALALSQETGDDVQFAFNDKIIRATPTSTLSDLHAQWGRPIKTAEQERQENADELEKMRREHAEAIAAAGVPTEQELYDAKEPWPHSMLELSQYIAALTDRPHNYGTCAYAMSLAACAAFNYVAHQLGTTGFQAGHAQMDFLRRQRNLKMSFQIIDHEKLLWPQYADALTVTPEKLLLNPSIRASIRKEAKRQLANAGTKMHEPHAAIVSHWTALANLPVLDGEPTE